VPWRILNRIPARCSSVMPPAAPFLRKSDRSPTRNHGPNRRGSSRSERHRSRSTSSRRSSAEDDDDRDHGQPPFAAAPVRASHDSAAVDRGLAGVETSLRSSWSTSPAIQPPMPNGEAVPTLLSHLAGGLCV